MWWLLAPNPFVVVADSAPHVPPRVTATGDVVIVDDYDPLSAIGRAGPATRAVPPRDAPVDYDGDRALPRPAVWPYGLAFNVLLGVGAVAVTAARLRTPSRRLARGVRIA